MPFIMRLLTLTLLGILIACSPMNAEPTTSPAPATPSQSAVTTAPATPTTSPSNTPTRLPPLPTASATALPPTTTRPPATPSPLPATATPLRATPTRVTTPTATPTRARGGTTFDPAKTTIRLEPVVRGFSSPVDAKHAGDGSGRLFIVEQAGKIRIVANGAVLPTPFLDITPLVNSRSSERGLLGVAFHPNYKSNGFFYVNYTDVNGDTAVVRYKASSDANRADPNSAQMILQVKQPAANHNGGALVFGPDGYLYIGLGDGGGRNDQFGNSQKPDALLAKLLRIDVNSGSSYGIPPDNPFVNRAGFRPEIWAWGLRNPWRYSFDRATGDLYIADVGQNTYEEVHFQPANSKGGENYGWNRMEGKHCFPIGSSCEPSLYVAPIGEYDHSRGDCSITGGYVYRGSAQPALTGAYFFADYCTGRFWSLHRNAASAWVQTELITTNTPISSFGEDEQGELYAVGYAGALYRIVAVAR